mmetsp:Transcript_3295/g.7756  ORF Transcript_3295/g.7756 Transcript_3295/m.7756 type:complete len:189 (+) Transcript_3295:131-697(+)|eukprot:CAMPEP_0178987204 /NCGR_PEP_ID=MMETSP0795-20121207/3134_1 /TAXON_ID=88552 /ORGANISM="Amoebophrya sp., Strain Ameob2" /LENGTH=188 /DNA_ID=CAMNT_0020678359 /DNA_START=110 /DNA_END=676 /DNA_ORIENTATION=+
MAEGKEVCMTLPRKKTQGAGSRRVDPEEEALRDLSNAIVSSEEYREMAGFIQECHEEEVAKIVKVRGLIENYPDGALLQYRRQLKRSTSALILDLDMYDIATREGNKKRVAHMARSSPWFKKNFKPLANISKNPSAPGFLSFNREDAPAAGSQRVYHRNSIYVREPNTYKNPALKKPNYALLIPLDQD